MRTRSRPSLAVVLRTGVLAGAAAAGLVVISLSATWRLALLAGVVGALIAAAGVRFSAPAAVVLVAIVALLALGGVTAGVAHIGHRGRNAHRAHHAHGTGRGQRSRSARPSPYRHTQHHRGRARRRT